MTTHLIAAAFIVGLMSGLAFGLSLALWLPKRRQHPAEAPTYHKGITVRRRAL